MTVLERILAETRQEVERRKREAPIDMGASPTMSAPLAPGSSVLPAVPGLQCPTAGRSRFRDALAGPGISVIAEFKRRSPSAGKLRESEPDIAEILSAYERGGARALSVLTEGPNFEGSLADIRAAREACALPILRKDFIVDPYQLHEACLAGADAVLLIVAALEDAQLASLHELAQALGLDVLVEVHDSEELDRAKRVGARLIGVNNRDLRDFSVDVARTGRLLGEMPAGALVVSESGISAPQQLRELEQQGVAAVLVGESLMRAPDHEQALVALLAGSSVRT
jgi:indole-3-glycerol phosphate synthase